MAIIAAAIRHGDLIISMPKPARHHDIINRFVAIEDHIIVSPIDQGFLTNKGQFLERKEAKQHAITCNQKFRDDYEPFRSNDLFSEDLW